MTVEILLVYGVLLGGMLTLIGTAPNIVVCNHLQAMGRDPFGFFSFTPIGIAMVVGIGFMALVGRNDREPRRRVRRRRDPAADLHPALGDADLDADQILLVEGSADGVARMDWVGAR